MKLNRNYTKTTYPDGCFKIFDPLICWIVCRSYQNWVAEIGLRGDWSIGILWGWRVGSWSRYRVRFVSLGKLTIYIHMGRRGAHNPLTGEAFE